MTEWREVPGHPGYEVSDDGQVRSLDRMVGGRWGPRKFPGKLLSVFPDKDGYMRTGLGGGTTQKCVHRLMLLAFVGGPPAGKDQTCHRDGNLSNNVLSNLYWGNTSDNTLDQVRHGTHQHARKTHCPEGHPYAGDNLGESATKRVCLECKCESEKRRKFKLWVAEAYAGCEAT